MNRAGSIKREGDTWFFVVDVGNGAGQRRQVRKRGFATKREARAALTEALGELQRGTYVRPQRITVAAYLDDWLASRTTVGLRPSTIAGYHNIIRRHVRPVLGDVFLQDLMPQDLDRLYADLLAGKRSGRPLARRTVRYIHTVLGKALRDAVRTDLIARNVARRATPPSAASARSPEMSVWTPDELREFLEVSAGSHHAAMLRVAALTGLRRSELCGLRWQDVDLTALRLVVRQAITTADHVPVAGETKTTRSRRPVDLDATTAAVLRAHRKCQREERLLLGPGWRDSGLVFTMPDGSAWHPDVITRAFARLVERSGLPRIRLHDLRHTHATHLLAAGINVRVVSERLGHASTAFTLDVYGHVLPGQQADAAAAAAALVDR
ncbi:MAG TPA: tyrosine-type recombinase/integrase [Acidimicrobiia bacterium]|nr:tyrosine-type recombinase/integrase [Acidimicrobiia bacterium]